MNKAMLAQRILLTVLLLIDRTESPWQVINLPAPSSDSSWKDGALD